MKNATPATPLEVSDRRGIINWTVVLVAAFAAIPPSLVAMATYFQASATHQLVNSRMTEMIAVVKASAAADATLAEKDKQERKELIEQAAPAAIHPAPAGIPAPAKP